MSADFLVAGFTVPVESGFAGGARVDHGIGGTGVFSPDGEPCFALSIVDEGGNILTAMLDELAIDRVANMLADFLEALPAIRSGVRH